MARDLAQLAASRLPNSTINVYARHPHRADWHNPATTHHLNDLTTGLTTTDAVITATRSPSSLITPNHIQPRTTTDLLAIDLSIPANIDPAINALDRVTLFTLDDLAPTSTTHQDAIIQAEQLVEHQLELLNTELTRRTAQHATTPSA